MTIMSSVMTSPITEDREPTGLSFTPWSDVQMTAQPPWPKELPVFLSAKISMEVVR